MSSTLERFTNRDGLAIAYRTWGAPGDRPPVVLLHGFIANGSLNWELPGVVAALVDAGHFVIAPDARGHGESDKPHDSAFYGEANMAGDVRELLDRLGVDRVHLAGYSMGAVISLLVASVDPRVRRLVVGGVGAGIVEQGGVDRRSLDNDALVAALLGDDPSGATAPAVEAFCAFADAIGGDRLALAAQARVVHQSPIALDRISAPTLVLAGVDDELAVRPMVLVDALPDARLVPLAGDHMGALLDPAFTTEIVDFFA